MTGRNHTFLLYVAPGKNNLDPPSKNTGSSMGCTIGCGADGFFFLDPDLLKELEKTKSWKYRHDKRIYPVRGKTWFYTHHDTPVAT